MAQSQYATAADLQAVGITPAQAARYGTTAITAQLQAASSLADSFLVSQFTLPLETAPQGWDMSLTLAVCNIAAYHLAKTTGFSPMAPGDDLITKSYEDALAWLRQIRDKEIFPQFTDSAGSPDEVEEGGPFVITSTQRGYSERGISPWSPPVPSTTPFSDD